jgi:hypothetical protein
MTRIVLDLDIWNLFVIWILAFGFEFVILPRTFQVLSMTSPPLSLRETRFLGYASNRLRNLDRQLSLRGTIVPKQSLSLRRFGK